MVQSIYETNDLILTLSSEQLSAKVTDYYIRNKEFLLPFEPVHNHTFYTKAHQAQSLKKDASLARQGCGYRFWISLKSDSAKVIGTIAFNSIVMGAFCSCFLGYKLDKDYLNCGYMTQALKRCVDIAFIDIGLHRIEANIMPRNLASLSVVSKVGFKNEGISPKYLKINGVWEDHIHMVLLNENNT